MIARREWALWITATAIVAALVYLAAVWAIPRVVMRQALAKLGPANTMHFAPPVTATSRVIVRPSPDMSYAACPYDISEGPLRVTAKVPHTTYWSISAFDAATDNFFVEDDQQIAGNEIDVIVMRHGQKLPRLGAATEEVMLFSPSERGLILIRMLADGAGKSASLQAMFHQANCAQVVATAPALR